MSFGTTMRRCNPLKADVLALTEPQFDPREQSWSAGALAAAETVAGGILAIPLLGTAVTCVWFVCLSPGQRQTHHIHHISGWLFYKVGVCSVMAAALLWAGLALMFGWRSRYRAHGVLAVVVVALAGVQLVMMATMAG